MSTLHECVNLLINCKTNLFLGKSTIYEFNDLECITVATFRLQMLINLASDNLNSVKDRHKSVTKQFQVR